jgi:hypothetical protein
VPTAAPTSPASGAPSPASPSASYYSDDAADASDPSYTDYYDYYSDDGTDGAPAANKSPSKLDTVDSFKTRALEMAIGRPLSPVDASKAAADEAAMNEFFEAFRHLQALPVQASATAMERALAAVKDIKPTTETWFLDDFVGRAKLLLTLNYAGAITRAQTDLLSLKSLSDRSAELLQNFQSNDLAMMGLVAMGDQIKQLRQQAAVDIKGTLAEIDARLASATKLAASDRYKNDAFLKQTVTALTTAQATFKDLAVRLDHMIGS